MDSSKVWSRERVERAECLLHAQQLRVQLQPLCAQLKRPGGGASTARSPSRRGERLLQLQELLQ